MSAFELFPDIKSLGPLKLTNISPKRTSSTHCGLLSGTNASGARDRCRMDREFSQVASRWRSSAPVVGM